MSLTASVCYVLLFVALALCDKLPLTCSDATNAVEKPRDCCYLEASQSTCCLKEDTVAATITCNCAAETDCALVDTPNVTPKPTKCDVYDTIVDTDIVTGTADSLCDHTQYKLFGGEAVPNNCTFAGIARILNKNTQDHICNAVYSTRKVGEDYVKTFYTAKECIPALAGTPDLDTKIMLEIGGVPYPVGNTDESMIHPLAVLADSGNVNLAYFKLDPVFDRLFTKMQCMIPACAFRDDMFAQVDFGKCRVVSYGPKRESDAGETLRKTQVVMSPFGCQKSENIMERKVCFRPAEGIFFKKEGDGGAALYCKATNNEDILVGIAGQFADRTTAPTDIEEVPIHMLKFVD